MSTEMTTCPVCGNSVVAGSKFCQNCGHIMSDGESARADVSQGTPTVNISAQPAPTAPTYAPPGPAKWEPGQYGTGVTPSAQPGQTTYMPPQPAYAAAYQPPAQMPVQQSYSQAPVSGQTYNANYLAASQRDPMVALLLELIGYIFVLGIGHMYAGRVTRGIGLLVGYWAYWGIVTVLFVTVAGIPIACLMSILHPVIPILSGLWARQDVINDRRIAGIAY